MGNNRRKNQNSDELIPDHDVVDENQLQAKPEVKPKYKMKGHFEFVHSLFKLKSAKMLKNVSYKWGKPEIYPMEHTHFFHTHDQNGREQMKSSAIGGHWHELEELGFRDDGTPFAKLGPAITKMSKDPETCRVYDRPVRESPAFWDRSGNGGRGGMIVDDHTHEIEYLHSESLTPAKGKAISRQTSEAIMSASPPPQPLDKEGFTEI